MSFDVVFYIVVINAFVTFGLVRWLRGIDLTKVNRPARLPKEAAKMLWRSDPIVPKHDPPNVDVRKFTGIFARARQEFFVDFKEFADVFNRWLAEKNVESRFRLEDLPSDDVGLIVRYDGPTPGRCFQLYYNQYPVGRLEIHPFDYTTATPDVWTDVEINRARYLSYDELTRFLGGIAFFVTDLDPKSDNHIASRRAIDTALIETLWANYENNRGRRDLPDFQDEDLGRLVVRFQGRAEWYISHARKQGQAAPPRSLS
jgi:hypothetical protein